MSEFWFWWILIGIPLLSWFVVSTTDPVCRECAVSGGEAGAISGMLVSAWMGVGMGAAIAVEVLR